MNIENEIQQTKFRNEYHKAAANLLFTSNWLSNQVKDFLKPHQITFQQYNVLRILNGQFPKKVSIQDIKDRMIDKMPDVSRIVERLRKQALIEREVSENDRRVVKLTINEKGRELLAVLSHYYDEMDAILANLDNQEIEILNQLLDKARGNYLEKKTLE